MTDTLHAPAAGSLDASRDKDRLVAGWSAVAFATLVVVNNVLLGSPPAFDADGQTVLRYFADHRTVNVAGVALYALTFPCLIAFVCTFSAQLRRRCRPSDLVWARIGTAGAMLIVPMFAAVMVPRVVLVAAADELAGEPVLAGLVWRWEVTALAINMLGIIVALVGLGVSASRCGLAPRWFGRWAPVAAACGLVTTMFTVASVEGSPVSFVAFVAFLSWLLFLYLVGIRQLRRP